MPFTAMEVLVKFLKSAQMKGRPILAAQLQLESLNYFERHFRQCGEKHLSPKLNETVIMPYLVMGLKMQQVAIDLLPYNEGEYQMPETIQIFHGASAQPGVWSEWVGFCSGFLEHPFELLARE